MSLRLFPVVGLSSSSDRAALLMPPFSLAIANASLSNTMICGEVEIDFALDGTVEVEACP